MAGIELTIFGVIENQAYFEAKVAPHLGSAVRYGGHMDGPDLAAAMARASVLLFTPLWDEPFGLTAIEAMACGVPVAATDMGAVREVIGRCGAFAPADDAALLADALKTAATLPRAACRQRVARHFSIDRMVDACERLYEVAESRRDAAFPPALFPPIELKIAPREAPPTRQRAGRCPQGVPARP